MGKALIFDGITVTSPLQTITISIPDEDVERIVTFFDTSISSEKESALKTLVTTLKNDGIWDKLTYLMLPVFASSNIEAAQNVLLSTETESITNINNWQFNNGEFTQVNNSTVSLTSYLKNPNNMDTQSIAVGAAFSLGTMPQNVSSEDVLKVNNAVKIYKESGNNTVGAGFNYGGGTFSTGGNSMLSASVNSVDLKYYYIKDNQTAITTKTVTTISTNPTHSFILGGSSSSQYQKNFTGNLKLAWVSTMLNPTELKNAHTAFKTFIDTLESLSE